MVFQNVETVCVICAKSVEWVLQLKRQVNCLDYIYSKILRQSLGLLACAQLYFPLKLIAVPCMYGGGEKYGVLCWASARAEGILICVIISRKSHIRPLPFCMSTSSYSLGLKSTLVLSFFWSQLYCHSQNLQKLIVNVFTNKKKLHSIKCYNCASEIKP